MYNHLLNGTTSDLKARGPCLLLLLMMDPHLSRETKVQKRKRHANGQLAEEQGSQVKGSKIAYPEPPRKKESACKAAFYPCLVLCKQSSSQMSMDYSSPRDQLNE